MQKLSKEEKVAKKALEKENKEKLKQIKKDLQKIGINYFSIPELDQYGLGNIYYFNNEPLIDPEYNDCIKIQFIYDYVVKGESIKQALKYFKKKNYNLYLGYNTGYYDEVDVILTVVLY